jgi:two-component system, chemotaxis family, chemotaxis protein CheY
MACTVLIVDDSATIRQMVKVTLSAMGYTVLEAANGEEALVKLQAQEVALIISDLHMPILDGLGLVKRVRAQVQFQFVPILLLTAEAASAQTPEGRQADATGWFVKPFAPDQLLKMVRRVLPD